MRRSKPLEFKLEMKPGESSQSTKKAVVLENDWQECLDGQDTFIEEDVEETIDEKWKDFGDKTFLDQEFSLDEPLGSDESDSVDSATEGTDQNTGKRLHLINHELGNGINLQIPAQFSQKVKNIQAKQFGVIKRNEIIAKMNIGIEEIYCSDTYRLIDSTAKKKNNNETFDVIMVPKQFTKNVSFSIRISRIENIDCYTFYAYIRTKTEWVKIDAELLQNANVVNFHANTLSAFCITYSPKVEEAVLNPHEEYQYVSCQDSRTRVNFPQDCVEKSEKLNFMLIPGDEQGMCWRRENNPEQYNVRAISHCLYVKHNIRRFLKQIKISLPINEDHDDCDLVFFRKSGDSINIIDVSSNDTICKNGDCGSIDVTGFSRHMAARIKSGSSQHVSNLEVELTMGLKKVCSILLFMKKDKSNFLTIWIEVSTKEKGKEIAEKRKLMGFTELKDCRSGDVFLKDASKIRIDVKGCIKPLRDIPKAFFFLTFLTLSEDNHLSFPVQIHQQLSEHPFAIISFTESLKSKKILHSAHFNPAPKPVPRLSVPRMDNRMKMGSEQNSVRNISRSQTFAGYYDKATKEVPQDRKKDLREDSQEQLPSVKNAWSDSSRKSKRKTRNSMDVTDDGYIAPDTGDIQVGVERNLSLCDSPQHSISKTSKSRKRGNSTLNQTWPLNVYQEKSANNPYDFPTAEKGMKAFFSDKSMGHLARRLTAGDGYNLAIELGVEQIEIEHLKASSHHPDPVQINLRLIIMGLSRINRGEKLERLIDALYQINMRNLAQIIDRVSNQQRSLMLNDFE